MLGEPVDAFLAHFFYFARLISRVDDPIYRIQVLGCKNVLRHELEVKNELKKELDAHKNTPASRKQNPRTGSSVSSGIHFHCISFLNIFLTTPDQSRHSILSLKSIKDYFDHHKNAIRNASM